MEYKNIKFTTIMEDSENASIFRHFKGKEYKIIGIAKDSETLKDLVIYQANYDDFQIYAREASMFFSKTDKVKYPEVEQEYRFELIDWGK